MALVANYIWVSRGADSTTAPPEACINRNRLFLSSTNIINATELEDLAMSTPVLCDMWAEIPRWIVKVDIGRVLYIYAHGGFYFDVDCLVKKPLQPLPTEKMVLFTERVLSSVADLGPRECKTPESVLRIANYAFGTTTVNHPFMKQVLDECIRRLSLLMCEASDFSDADILWVCGPDVITTVYHRAPKDSSDILLLDTTHVDHLCAGTWRTVVSTGHA